MGSQLFFSNTVAALTLLSSCQTSPKPKRGNAKCASGAKSPEAPNDPCSNMTGRISSLKKSINLNNIPGMEIDGKWTKKYQFPSISIPFVF